MARQAVRRNLVIIPHTYDAKLRNLLFQNNIGAFSSHTLVLPPNTTAETALICLLVMPTRALMRHDIFSYTKRHFVSSELKDGLLKNQKTNTIGLIVTQYKQCTLVESASGVPERSRQVKTICFIYMFIPFKTVIPPQHTMFRWVSSVDAIYELVDT